MAKASKLSRPINVFPKPKQSKTSDPPRFFQNYLTPINVFNMDARTSVSNQTRLHFLPVETALTRNWHSPRSHSGTLSSRKRSGSPGGEKSRRESHFTRNVEPPIFAKPIFLLQRVNHKIDLFSFVSFFSFFFYYTVVNHDHGGSQENLSSWFIPHRDFTQIFSRL